MAIPFDEYQGRKNREFYRGKGTAYAEEFRTFASDLRFVKALATDFYRKMKDRSGEKAIRVYEFGVGDGSLGTRFMLELRKLGEELSERTIYNFCDFSEELVRNATKRADSFGFNAEGIVYDAIGGEPKFLVDADYILMNEFYDDLPAKILLREGKNVKELFIENGKRIFQDFKGDEELKEYMMKMPEGYQVPLNITAKKHLDYCISRMKGYIDVFDYGFRKEEITEMPAEMWNDAIIREFGGQIRKNLACSEMEFPTDGQITTDVNFDFIAGKRKVETQLEFVERVLGGKFHEVETDRLRYLTEEEIEKRGKELGKYGYEPGFQKELRESRGFLHLRVE